MNITRFDRVKSFESGNTLSFVVLFTAEILILPFYTGWVLYFLSEAFVLRRRIRALLYRGPSSERTRLLYKCRGDYYKNIFLFLIALIEPISLIPALCGTIPIIELVDLKSSNSIVSSFRLSSDFRSFSYVLSSIIIFLLNTLTQHLINVCKSDCRIQLLPPIQHRLVILTLIAMILTAIKLAIQEFDNVIVEVVCAIFSSYEYWSLFKNSKQLYYLLKWRYQDMRYESNYPLYKAHRRMAQKYKYLTIYLMFGIFFQIAVGWVDIPYSLFLQKLGSSNHLNYDVILAFKVLKWFNTVLIAVSSTPQLLVVTVTLYYIAAVCLNKIGCGRGRKRVRYLQEPIIQ